MSPEVLKKLCIYRSLHRGCKELDVIMERYIKARIDSFSKKELLLYSELLSLDDGLIYDYIMGWKHVPEDNVNDVLVDFIKFTNSILA